MISRFTRLLCTTRPSFKLYRPAYRFCQKNTPSPPIMSTNEPEVTTNEKDGTLQFELNDITGTKEGGPIYAVIFTCSPCGNKMARTFTQNAYHNGVVLVRCDNCQNIHLMADNLGWFEDGKWNIESHANAQRITSPQVKAILEGFMAKK